MDLFVNKNQKQLRCGITTGTCTTVAAKAAAKRLLLDTTVVEEKVATPKGIVVTVPVTVEITDDKAIGTVYKDSGDDPDVTNGMEIKVSVSRINGDLLENHHYFVDEDFPGLFLDGGQGVGRVTKPGLEQGIGYAAINVVPRRMIFQNVYEVLQLSDETSPLLIQIIFPKGEELAKRTFNPQLGIVGGISVLGTSGIVEPMSEKALVDTIETEIRQKQAEGVKHLILMPGNYGQSYVQEQLGFSLEHSVKCSNYIGESIDLCISYGMESVLLVGNIGKFVKMAAGIMNTHSKVADGRMEILALHTYLCGGTREMVDFILQSINTEGVVTYLKEQGMLEKVMRSICEKIEQHVKRRAGGMLEIGVCIFSENHQLLGKTSDAEMIMEKVRLG